MSMLYRKPEVRSLSGNDVSDCMGPVQAAYTATLNPTATPDNATDRGDLDGFVYNLEGEYYTETAGYEGETVLGLMTGITRAGGPGAPHMPCRSFIGFDISGINSTVLSATLTIYKGEDSSDPFTDLGPLIVEHVEFGDSLDVGDYNISGTTITTISSEPAGGTVTVDVDEYVQDDLDNGRSFSQFRLRFTNDDIVVAEITNVQYADSEGHYGDQTKPVLEVSYE